MPRSPKNPTIFRTTSSNPGTARKDCSADRSAACSHAIGAICERMTRLRVVGMLVIGFSGRKWSFLPYAHVEGRFQSRPLGLLECLVQVGQEVVGFFYSD